MKINRTIARAIAGQVIDNVSKLTSDQQDKLRKEINGLPETKELHLISKQITSLEKKVRSLEEKLQRRYPDIRINWRQDYLNVNFSSGRGLRTESIANDVILANQLQGIEIPKLMEHVSKKYMNGSKYNYSNQK